MSRHRSAWRVVLILVAFTGVLWAQPSSWWDRFFNRTPNVLNAQTASAGAPLVKPHPDAINLQNSFAEVADAVKPAVVNIAAVQVQQVQQDPQFYYGDPNEFFYRFFGQQPPQRRAPAPREFRTEGTGSGVIIDADGYILTNNHVVQGADQLTVTLSGGKSFKGKVVGTDPRSDLAVIRIKGTNPFPFVPLGDSASMRVGDWVLAIGSPFGLEQTVTSGIISAIRQSLSIEGRNFRNLIQTDAAINRGNSGGPLVNIRGEVVGVNTAIYAPTGVFSGIGFAIPINEAKKILKDLIQKGYVERSWLGVEIAEVDEVIAQQFGLRSAVGALINGVVNGSPADKAGLRRGDIVLQYDGKQVANVQALQDMVSATAPQKKVKVKVLRDGREKTVEVTTAAMPNQRPEQYGQAEEVPGEESAREVTWLGATAITLTPAMQDGGTVKGALLRTVPPDSQAAEAGLQDGDVIQGVNNQPVQSAGDLRDVKVDLKKGAVFDVLRRGRSFYLTYKALQ